MSKTIEGLGFLLLAAGIALREGSAIVLTTFWATHVASPSFHTVEECELQDRSVARNGEWIFGLVQRGSGIPILSEAEAVIDHADRVVFVVDTSEDARWFSFTKEEIAESFAASTMIVHHTNSPGGDA